MNTNKKEHNLAEMQYTYSSNIGKEVMLQIKKQKELYLPNTNWLLTRVAASILLCLALIYIQDGSISYDTIIGTELLYSSNINEILNYL